MAFTVRQLKEALEANDVPDDAVVFIEFGAYVKAVEKMAVMDTEKFPVFVLQAPDAAEAMETDKDIH